MGSFPRSAAGARGSSRLRISQVPILTGLRSNRFHCRGTWMSLLLSGTRRKNIDNRSSRGCSAVLMGESLFYTARARPLSETGFERATLSRLQPSSQLARGSDIADLNPKALTPRRAAVIAPIAAVARRASDEGERQKGAHNDQGGLRRRECISSCELLRVDVHRACAMRAHYI